MQAGVQALFTVLSLRLFTPSIRACRLASVETEVKTYKLGDENGPPIYSGEY